MAIEDTIQQAADKLMKAVEAYGPKATELVLETGRIAAVQNLVSSAVGAALFVGLGVLSARYATRWLAEAAAIRKERGARWRNDEEIKFVIGGILCCAGGAIAAMVVLISAFDLIDIKSWVGVWRPEIYLAAKLLKL